VQRRPAPGGERVVVFDAAARDVDPIEGARVVVLDAEERESPLPRGA
jgi:hypothetical protein